MADVRHLYFEWMLFWAPSSPRMANMQHWCKLSRTGRDTPACVFPRWQSSTIFVILQFWTTHEVALMGCMLQDNGVTIRSDVTNRLLFYIFGNLAGKYIFVPLLRQFLAHNGRRGGPMLNPRNFFLLFGFLTSIPLFVKIDHEMQLWECGQTNAQTDWCTQNNSIICRMLCYSYGADKKSDLNARCFVTAVVEVW